MEMENRRRELARKRRKRQRARRRRILVGGLAVGVLCLGAGVWAVSREDGLLERSRRENAEVLAGDSGSAGENLAENNRPGLGNGVQATGNVDVHRGKDGDSVVGSVLADSVEIVPRESAMTQSARDQEELPSRYDLREIGTAPEVPDQGTFGTCWAFASLGALESSMPGELRTRLSADHMSLRNSFGLGQDAGGDYSISTAYLLAWQGPVEEAADPYGDGYSPDDLEPVCHVQEIQILKEKDYDAIKRAVYETGGVQSSFYMPQSAGAERDRYYNEETDAFYYDGSLEANHDVVIVGWEDSYPKENFVKEPEEDGAFLCMNTWGESFGDRGYFYISYEDSRIGTSNVSYTRTESPENYDAIYQTDLCGWTGQLGYGASEAWFGNVYEAQEDGFLAAAGFYAVAPDTSYKAYVVRPEAGSTGDSSQSLTDDRGWPGGVERTDNSNEAAADAVGTAFADRRQVAEGHVDNAGFYTVSWDAEIPVKAGERFAVIMELESVGTTEPVAVEYVSGERTENVDLGDGEGYISPDGVNWQRVETAQNCNVCLKAYVRRE